MKPELPAVQKAYDLTKELLIRVAKFPRSYKFTLGDRMVLTALNILESLVEAAYSQDKPRLLHSANLQVERLRFLLRLSCNIGSISNNGYAYVAEMLNELGKQIGGWIKQTKGANAPKI